MSSGVAKKAGVKGSERADNKKRGRASAGLDEQVEEGDVDEEVGEEEQDKEMGETQETSVLSKMKKAKFVFDDEGEWDFTTMVPEVKLERPKTLTRALQPTKVYFTPLIDKKQRLVFVVIDGAYGARHYLATFDNVRMYFKDTVKAVVKDLNAHGESDVLVHNETVRQAGLDQSECEFHSIIIEDHCPYIVPRGNGNCVYALYIQEFAKLQETYDLLVSIIHGKVNRDGPLIHGQRHATKFEVVQCPAFHIDTKEREVALKALIQMPRIPRLRNQPDYTGAVGEESLLTVDEFSFEGMEDPSVPKNVSSSSSSRMSGATVNVSSVGGKGAKNKK